MSKLRYGLQLCTNVRIDETEKKNANMKSLQISQNKLMRLLINAPYLDRTSTSTLLEKTGLLSVNQTAACIKLIGVWKGLNITLFEKSLLLFFVRALSLCSTVMKRYIIEHK